MTQYLPAILALLLVCSILVARYARRPMRQEPGPPPSPKAGHIACLSYSYTAIDPVSGALCCRAIPGGPVDRNTQEGAARLAELNRPALERRERERAHARAVAG